MKFTIDIPDLDVIATANKVASHGPTTQPSFEDAVSEIQAYFDVPYNKVKRDKVKTEDAEVLAKAAEIEQKKQEYADLIAQKSGTPKEGGDAMAANAELI